MDYSYIGSGKVYMRIVGAAAGLVEVGNCSKLTFTVKEDVKEQKDYTSPGGGVANEVRRITGVEASMTLHDISPANLAKAVYGTTSEVAAGSVTDEVVTGYQGALSRLAKAKPTSVVVTAENGNAASAWQASNVYALGDYMIPITPNGYFYKCTTAGTSAAAEPTWGTVVGGTTADNTAEWTCMGKVDLVVDTDYEVRPGGIFFLAGGSTTDGETFEVDYNYGAQDLIQALESSAQEYEVVFDGLNEARSAKSVVVDVWRLRPGPAKELSLIGDNFAGLEMTGKCLKDSSKTGGTSQYFRATMEQ